MQPGSSSGTEGGDRTSTPDPRLPLRAGTSFKPEYRDRILTDSRTGGDAPSDGKEGREAPASPHQVGWFEIHAENYMTDSAPLHRWLTRLREDWPLSIHGVGASLGGSEPLCEQHLSRLATLVDRYQPHAVSEHLAWSSHEGVYLADLLPFPYNEETLGVVCDRVDQLQARLKRRVLVENPSTYLRFDNSTLEEIEFLEQMAARTGCGLLLDVSNVVVCGINQGTRPEAYLDRFPAHLVGEIHIAGFTPDQDGSGQELLIDTHDGPVDESVWEVLERFLSRAGPRPVLVEWDDRLPEWAELVAQVERAQSILDRTRMQESA